MEDSETSKKVFGDGVGADAPEPEEKVALMISAISAVVLEWAVLAASLGRGCCEFSWVGCAAAPFCLLWLWGFL